MMKNLRNRRLFGYGYCAFYAPVDLSDVVSRNGAMLEDDLEKFIKEKDVENYY